MRKLFIVSIALCLLATADRLTAQQPEVKPGPEHMKLKESEGTWDATIKSKDGDSKGTFMFKLDLNGLWLMEHFKADFGGMAFEGRGATSYDPTKKKYVSVWIDSMSTSPMISEGTYDAAKKTMTMKGDMPMPDGKNMKVTLTTVDNDANNKTFTIHGDDKGDFEILRITYKRRAK